MRERTRNLVVRLADDELARLHALADASDEPVARVVRRLIARECAQTFGEAPPRPQKGGAR